MLGRENVGEVAGCLDAAELEVPVRAEEEWFGTLLLSLHIERSGFERKDRQALATVGKMVGMKLSSARLWAQVERLRTEPDSRGAASQEARPCPLSDREVEVLELAAQGLRNKEIAERLFISEKTVAHHLESIYEKTRATGRTDAAVKAAMKGWILPQFRNNIL